MLLATPGALATDQVQGVDRGSGGSGRRVKSRLSRNADISCLAVRSNARGVKRAVRPRTMQCPRRNSKIVRISRKKAADKKTAFTFIRTLQEVNSSSVRQWLKSGDLARLEEMVLHGRGHQLLGQYSPDPRVRYFLKQVPALMGKINEVHEAAARGDLAALQRLAKSSTRTTKKILLGQKGGGLIPLHKAVYYGHHKIVQFLIGANPESVHLRDSEGRTGLHYCGSSTSAGKIWQTLIKAGADPEATDSKGRLPAYYMECGNEISLPTERIFADGSSMRNGIPIKASNIRIWIHDRDFEKLQKLVWEGHGGKLLAETSNNPKVKRFLEGVPLALNAIRDVHLAVINDDYEDFVKRTSGVVPIEILGSKDANGLNPLHKASGLGRLEIAKNIIDRNEELIDSVDEEGRTPLHFAAASFKTDDSTYNFLVSRKADEMALDINGKNVEYYKSNPREILKYLKVIPEAPRTALGHSSFWEGMGAQSSDSTPPILAPIQETAVPSVRSLSPLALQESKGKNGSKNDEEDPNISLRRNDSNEDTGTENEENRINEGEPRSGEKEDGGYWLNENSEEIEDVANAIDESSETAEHYEIWTNKDTETENEMGLETEAEKKGINEISKVKTENQNQNLGSEEPGCQEKKDEKEKTPWEIGEERQRLLDEGLVKIDDEDDEDDDGEDKDKVGGGGDITEKVRDVDQMIKDGDLEALASLILNGKGDKLIGKFSENAEVQAFLENLPSYLNKIAAVHRAVRCGSLKDLQATLDRRRFAVAKESAGKVGATPLHVAVLFQKPHIVKYLGGRFPETLSFKDNFGRTPLHYAALLPDDGHFFNVLLNLGSDRKVRDDDGLNPGDYHDNPNAPTYENLLEEYDAPAQVAKDMLSGQNYTLFGPEDGKYLAEAVGGPLVRGLTQVANARPTNPVAYLADFLYEFLNRNKGSEEPPKGKEAFDDEGEITTKACEEGRGQGEEERDEDWEHETGTSFSATERDEFGQSILHFAAARAHGRTGLFQLIQESGANLGCRDELYRTARDVAMQANIRENMNEIDKYVISLAARGEMEKIKELYLEGYDHIVDLKDEEAEDIVTIASNKNQEKMAAFLKAIPGFEANREKMHEAIREGNFKLVRDMIGESKNGKFVVIGKNTSGRCSLHIAVLCQQKEITEYLAQKYPESLKIGDNLERTAMHYAMGVDQVETLSKILIKCGAQRISKDLKGRQPTYYFMNKSEISKLQEEESC